MNESTGGELAGSLKVHADNAGLTLASIVAPFGDFDSPMDSYFFMHLRTDAQSAQDGEEESSLTLENGLPASPKAIIIDHRIRDPHNLWWMAQSVD